MATKLRRAKQKIGDWRKEYIACKAQRRKDAKVIAKLRYALGLAGHTCGCLHHEKKHQHSAIAPCPVEKIIFDALNGDDTTKERQEET